MMLGHSTPTGSIKHIGANNPNTLGLGILWLSASLLSRRLQQMPMMQIQALAEGVKYVDGE
jgi:hypothetical protein